MGIRFKQDNDINSSLIDKSKGIFENTSTYHELSNENIILVDRNYHPNNYIERFEKFCDRNNPETYAFNQNLENINKLSCKDKILEVIKNKNNNITTRLIINELDINHISDGDRIRKVVCFLNCLGKIKKNMILSKDLSKDKTKLKYLLDYEENEQICPYLKESLKKNGKKKLKCIFDWSLANQTFIYHKDDA